MITASLGITDLDSITPAQVDRIRDAHLLLCMYNAWQPGVFALSGWDLVGALPLAREQVSGLIATGDEIVADEYSIADIALMPYVASMSLSRDTDLSHLRHWKNQLLARDAVRTGMAFMDDKVQKQTIAGGMDGFGDEHRSVLFGDRQYNTRR